MSIEGTVRRVLGGEREAYAEIVEACQDRLRAALGGYCRSAEELEEVCHLAFIEAYRKLAEFDPGRGPFVSWLLTIGRNGLLMELRRRKAEGERAARYLERAAESGPAFEDAERARLALANCLAELGPAEREMVSARYGGGWTSEKLAAKLGKTAGAVRMLLQRLRERLRECIERRLGAEGEP